jgi:hypothetical protein
MHDERERLLAQFTRRGNNAPPPNNAETSASEPEDGSVGYQAYRSVDRKQARLELRSAMHASEWVPYGYLLRIVVDPLGKHLALIFTFMAITVHGENLELIAHAVADERCDYIQEFSPKRWGKPADSEAAFVESIEFIVDKPPMSAAEKEAVE